MDLAARVARPGVFGTPHFVWLDAVRLSALVAFVEVWKLLPEVSNFGRIVVDDVGIVGMARRVILMIWLGRIESRQRYDLGDDAARKYLGLTELRDISFGNPFLFVAVVEDYRSILTALIRTLAVELGGVVGHGKEYLKNSPIGDP